MGTESALTIYSYGVGLSHHFCISNASQEW